MKESGVTIGNSSNSKTYKMISPTNATDVTDKDAKFLNR